MSVKDNIIEKQTDLTNSKSNGTKTEVNIKSEIDIKTENKNETNTITNTSATTENEIKTSTENNTNTKSETTTKNEVKRPHPNNQNTTNTNIDHKKQVNNNIKPKNNSSIENTKQSNSQISNENSKKFKTYSGNTKNSKLEIFWLSIIVLLIIVLLVFIIFTIVNVNNTNIINGVSIKGIDVSNLSKEEAFAKIQDYVNENIPSEIKLKHNDYETSISTQSLSLVFDIQSAVNKAYSIGRSGNIFDNNFEIIKTKFSPTDVDLSFSIDDEALNAALADISTKLPDTVIQSSYYIENNNLIITKGSEGNVVNVAEMAEFIKEEIGNFNIKDNQLDIITQVESPSAIDIEQIHTEIYKEPKDAYYTQNPFTVYPSENGIDFAVTLEEAQAMLQEEKEEYTIPLKTLYPSVTTNMIGNEAFPDLLSQFSTYYSASDKDRTTNLVLAANKINGTVVMPGETFSYNTVVGERTIAAGYKEAPIYVNGKVVDGLGGGICQITSTLYNAVLYANLEVVERSNHQFVPSYVKASRDATVVYGSIDFKFKNNRNYPIKIVCSVSGGVAKFQIYGLKTSNEYEVEISSRITSQNANYTYSEAYKILKQNGKVVSTTLLSRDTYKRH